METNVLLKAYLKRLRLPTMARDFEKLAQEAAETDLPYERYLLSLAEQEALAREASALRIRLKRAQFPVLKTFETFDFSAAPGVPKQKVLQLAQGEYLAKAENLILLGNPGTGKTHLAIALGVAACRSEKKVRFATAAGLVNELLEAQAQHELSRLERQLDKFDLVVLDELGYVPFSKAGAELLFAFCAARYERKSLLVTTNLEFSDWPQVFGEERMTGALLDRLTHRCHILKVVGDSYRFRESQEKSAEAGG
ncbi:MAG: ATP-binding protein [Planctomycetes bacterium]|nr:ATP-binding protein [Planctomycetota bacterium]